MDWHLECSACGKRRDAAGLPTVCDCGQPWLVRYPGRRPDPGERAAQGSGRGMWRFRSFLPLEPGESPVTLGEGDTPLLAVPRIKARGLSAAITRAVPGGARRFTLPTAGNAGVAASAYGARAGVPVRVYAPR